MGVIEVLERRCYGTRGGGDGRGGGGGRWLGGGGEERGSIVVKSTVWIIARYLEDTPRHTSISTTNKIQQSLIEQRIRW